MTRQQPSATHSLASATHSLACVRGGQAPLYNYGARRTDVVAGAGLKQERIREPGPRRSLRHACTRVSAHTVRMHVSHQRCACAAPLRAADTRGGDAAPRLHALARTDRIVLHAAAGRHTTPVEHARSRTCLGLVCRGRGGLACRGASVPCGSGTEGAGVARCCGCCSCVSVAQAPAVRCPPVGLAQAHHVSVGASQPRLRSRRKAHTTHTRHTG